MLIPSIKSVQRAIKTVRPSPSQLLSETDTPSIPVQYELQGGSASLFVCDDGMQVSRPPLSPCHLVLTGTLTLLPPLPPRSLVTVLAVPLGRGARDPQDLVRSQLGRLCGPTSPLEALPPRRSLQEGVCCHRHHSPACLTRLPIPSLGLQPQSRDRALAARRTADAREPPCRRTRFDPLDPGQ